MFPFVRFSINPSIRVPVFTGCILVLAAEVRYGNVIRFDLLSLGTMPTGSLSLTTSLKTDVSIAGLFDEAFLQDRGKPGLRFGVTDRKQGVPFLTFLRKTFPKNGGGPTVSFHDPFVEQGQGFENKFFMVRLLYRASRAQVILSVINILQLHYLLSRLVSVVR